MIYSQQKAIGAGALKCAAIAFTLFSALLTNAAWCTPEKFDEHYKKAEALYDQNKYESCIEELNKAIAEAPNRFEGYLKRARALNQIGRAKEALPDFNKALKFKPKQGDIYQSRGLSYQIMHEYDKALADYCRCIELDPGFEKAYNRIFTLASIYEDKNDYKNAFRVYAVAIKNKSSCARAYRYRGLLHGSLGHFKEALADVNKGIELKPKDSEQYYARAKVYHAQKKYKEAISDLEKAMELNSKNSKYYTTIGAMYVLVGDPKKALEFLDKAVSMDPGSASAHNNRGVALQKLGQDKQAKIEFDRAVATDKTRELYYENHAKMAMLSGDSEEAFDDIASLGGSEGPKSHREVVKNHRIVIAQFTKVIKLNPDEASNYYSRAVAYYCVADYNDAHQDLDRFLKLTQWKGEAPAFAAMLDANALRKMGKENDATALIKEADKHYSNSWISTLLKNYLGRAPKEEVVHVSKQSNKQTVARCFLGLNLLSLGDVSHAKDCLKWVCDNADFDSEEYSLANASLLALEPEKPDSKNINQAKANQLNSHEPTLIIK